MLSAIELNRIICNVDCSYIITMKQHSLISQQAYILQYALQPNHFTESMSLLYI
jgi:hypothetical protein